jgi:hypothetical protein
MNNYRLIGRFTTRSPLSHIGESISTNSYLSQDSILQPNGEIEEVFSYSGNAWRGQLRDLCSCYFVNKLDVKIGLDFFHLLFSGGKIGGEQSINIEKAKEMRKLVPMFSLFGGSIGTQIIAGKMKIGSSYPLCAEAMPALPMDTHLEAGRVSYSSLTMEKNFTRKDDSKRLSLHELININDINLLSDEERSKKKNELSTQMIMSTELLAAGVTLLHQIDLVNVTDIELGALISGFKLFSMYPYIGGQSNKGHGLVDYFCTAQNMDTNEIMDIIKIESNNTKITSFGQEKLDLYDSYLIELKNEIEGGNSSIAKLMGI